MSGTCCCGSCTVGQGTLIIGILDIIGGIYSVVTDSMEIHTMINYPDKIEDPDFKEYPTLYVTLDSISIFMMVVFFILACLMIYGYRKRNHRWITPWLIWSYVTLAYGAVMVVVCFCIIAVAGRVAEGFLFLILAGFFLGLQVYFIFVVKRFVDELKGGVVN
ncbi:uncharacterized protein LOC110849787 isoform X2 [Folsomia candida]|uniref:Lysosomal-associated transmembrane protein 4A n=1 Tax=Folsomia candida TaxID=158441 RepID=A0A226E812_FOLCA|nr:uncharacterized protein LOC110849787 isoform X1 [Folsomia candida]XP_021952929.1 uncharacterized protein LOC110849787 isoform X2 [Folsomia candida]OXA53745.1 hypothetical protein Fcan01_10102 [Folsomia candida]